MARKKAYWRPDLTKQEKLGNAVISGKPLRRSPRRAVKRTMFDAAPPRPPLFRF